MPIYEYEPLDRECLMCDGKIAIMQGIQDPACEFCPHCGMEVKRVISQVSFSLSKRDNIEKAGKMGFTTWKKVEEGKWEKMSGEGPDYLIGSKEDIAQVKAEKEPPAKIVKLDDP